MSSRQLLKIILCLQHSSSLALPPCIWQSYIHAYLCSSHDNRPRLWKARCHVHTTTGTRYTYTRTNTRTHARTYARTHAHTHSMHEPTHAPVAMTTITSANPNNKPASFDLHATCTAARAGFGSVTPKHGLQNTPGSSQVASSETRHTQLFDKRWVRIALLTRMMIMSLSLAVCFPVRLPVSLVYISKYSDSRFDNVSGLRFAVEVWGYVQRACMRFISSFVYSIIFVYKNVVLWVRPRAIRSAEVYPQSQALLTGSFNNTSDTFTSRCCRHMSAPLHATLCQKK